MSKERLEPLNVDAEIRRMERHAAKLRSNWKDEASRIVAEMYQDTIDRIKATLKERDANKL